MPRHCLLLRLRIPLPYFPFPFPSLYFSHTHTHPKPFAHQVSLLPILLLSRLMSMEGPPMEATNTPSTPRPHLQRPPPPLALIGPPGLCLLRQTPSTIRHILTRRTHCSTQMNAHGSDDTHTEPTKKTSSHRTNGAPGGSASKSYGSSVNGPIPETCHLTCSMTSGINPIPTSTCTKTQDPPPQTISPGQNTGHSNTKSGPPMGGNSFLPPPRPPRSGIYNEGRFYLAHI